MKKYLILIILIFITGCKYNEYKTPKDVIIELNNNTFLVNEKHNSNELVKNINARIIKNDPLVSHKIGNYTYTLTYEYKNKIYKYDIPYHIIDNTKPTFLNSPNSVTLIVNSDDYLCDRISYADNYDSSPTCKIEGEYDFTKLGKYNLEFVIKDSSNNENRKKFVLNIVDKLDTKNNQEKPNYIDFSDIIKKYKTKNTSIGIDISKWQGNIDFKKIKEAGVEFVIMRIGYQKNPDDEFVLDPKFNEYYQKAKEENLKVSVYVYNVALNEISAIKCSKWVSDNLHGDKLDLPIGYDFENWSDFNSYNTSLYTLSKSYDTFSKALNLNGYETMLYSSKYYLENAWQDYDNANVWLAHYTNKTDFNGNYILWQMTSLAKIDGITENTVDVDILYKKN